jgi:hypothetical protein
MHKNFYFFRRNKVSRRIAGKIAQMAINNKLNDLNRFTKETLISRNAHLVHQNWYRNSFITFKSAS